MLRHHHPADPRPLLTKLAHRLVAEDAANHALCHGTLSLAVRLLNASARHASIGPMVRQIRLNFANDPGPISFGRLDRLPTHQIHQTRAETRQTEIQSWSQFQRATKRRRHVAHARQIRISSMVMSAPSATRTSLIFKLDSTSSTANA
jgi:hypothetical protein